jgi:zinc transport system substrate-binding protein
VGVTLHPYFSWTANVVGDAAVVVPAIPGGFDPHSYQPRPEDLRTLASLDAIVVNGLGHDDFVEPMLEAAGKKDIPRIRAGAGVPVIPARGTDGLPNSHTFIALTGASQGAQTIARELGRLDPAHASLYADNARAYGKRLRAMLADALKKLDSADASAVRIATVHDGYAYLLRELGLTIAAVVQPRHGVEPSAKQLADTIERIRAANVNVLFTEMDIERRYVDTIERETKCRILKLSHMAGGEYSAGRFERDMQANLDAIVAGVTAAAPPRK